jgi:hypothetical protein
VPDRFAPVPALGPTQSRAGIAGKISPPHRSEDLVREDLVRPAREDLGWSDDRGFGQREDLGGRGFTACKAEKDMIGHTNASRGMV